MVSRPHRAYVRDLIGLLVLNAIKFEKENRMLSINLTWPQEITETEFFGTIEKCPELKPMIFWRLWHKALLPRAVFTALSVCRSSVILRRFKNEAHSAAILSGPPALSAPQNRHSQISIVYLPSTCNKTPRPPPKTLDTP
jgi:hypothetical protein